MNTNWYVASLLMSQPTAAGTRGATRQCQYLIEAGSHDEAYDQALEIGCRTEGAAGWFVGIADLALIHERPSDGSGILWSESEMAEAEIESRLLRRDDMRAFREKPPESGWYIGSVILLEVHDEGSHGERSLVWINTYLIKASSPDDAYGRVVRIGMGQEDEPGSHRCDGDKAHWEFRGAGEIIPASEAPVAGAHLWCDEADAGADSHRGAIPAKSELAVFRWEAEQRRRVR